MTKNSQKALKAYLLLPAKEKLWFLNEVTKIEKMDVEARKDYITMLFTAKP